ncbi:hypothetical protein DACRYDRAFT_107988 [Dacryopinax primogenitus]|uniref:RING-type domain-containing protein n=1 Tax=Dacryopinax primogenitus (strain DJM 731) TaxID=1858805 RepID=M5GBP7_DACPD|nr:uncharacterized protein DACRYDRAFT_107988 [Dacryopinax primogenitus]EJU01438.1 hypothetical protein DACRYDRAFT_107988 [Dacryopinax primogenitus]
MANSPRIPVPQVEVIEIINSSPMSLALSTAARRRTRSRSPSERRSPEAPPSGAEVLSEDVIDIDDLVDESVEIVESSGHLKRRRTQPPQVPPTAESRTVARAVSPAGSTPEPPGGWRTRRHPIIARSPPPAPRTGPSQSSHVSNDIIILPTPPSGRTLRSSARRSSASIGGLALPAGGVRGVDLDPNFYLPPDPPHIPSHRNRRTARPQTPQAGPSNTRKRKQPPRRAPPVVSLPDKDVFIAAEVKAPSRGPSPITPLSSPAQPGSPTHSGSSGTTIPAAPPTPPPLQPLTSYTCPICFSPPAHATITPCGHLMCGECLYNSVKANLERAMQAPPGDAHPQCPVCRANLHLRGTRFDGGGKNCAVGMWALEEIELR